MNGKSGSVDSAQTEGRGGTGRFDQRSSYWIGALPTDGRLRLTVAWVEIGLPETSADVHLQDLTDLRVPGHPLGIAAPRRIRYGWPQVVRLVGAPRRRALSSVEER